MTLAFPFIETPVGMGVWIGAFAVNRFASLVGLSSTFYQYNLNLNGVNLTDVVINGIAFTFGWNPQFTEPLSIALLFYSGYRLYEENN